MKRQRSGDRGLPWRQPRVILITWPMTVVLLLSRRRMISTHLFQREGDSVDEDVKELVMEILDVKGGPK